MYYIHAICILRDKNNDPINVYLYSIDIDINTLYHCIRIVYSLH